MCLLSNIVGGAVMRLRLGASGSEKLCALGAIGRFYAAPQLHRFRGPYARVAQAHPETESGLPFSVGLAGCWRTSLPDFRRFDLRVSVTSAIDPRSTPRQTLILIGPGVPVVLLGLLYQWIFVSHS
jgi:hypothetical protein